MRCAKNIGKPARFLVRRRVQPRSRGCDAERGVHAGPDAAASHPEHGRNVTGDRPRIEQGRARDRDQGQEPLAGVLRSLVAHGGRVVDTWPRNADNDAGFGRVIGEPELRDKLFVTTKIDQVGKEAGNRAVSADSAALRTREARPRADFQSHRSRHALAEPEGVEGGRACALHRRDGRRGGPLRAPRAVSRAREARFHTGELFDHGARQSRSGFCRWRRTAVSRFSSTGRS